MSPGCKCCGTTLYAGCGAEGDWPPGFLKIFKARGALTGDPFDEGYYPDIAMDIDGWSSSASNCFTEALNRTLIVVNYWSGSTWFPNQSCAGAISPCCWGIADTDAGECPVGSGCIRKFHAGASISCPQETAGLPDRIDGEPTKFLRPVIDFGCWDQLGASVANAQVDGIYQSPRGNPAEAIKIAGTWYVPPVPIDLVAGVDVPVNSVSGSGGGGCVGGSPFTITYTNATVRLYSP